MPVIAAGGCITFSDRWFLVVEVRVAKVVGVGEV